MGLLELMGRLYYTRWLDANCQLNAFKVQLNSILASIIIILLLFIIRT